MMTLIMKQQQDITTLKEEVSDLKMLFTTIAKNTKDKDQEISEEKDKDEDNVESEQTFKCEVCEYTCTNAGLLQKHIKTKHQDMKQDKVQEKTFFCHDCNKSFNSKKSFKKHEKSHSTSNKKSKCGICEENHENKRDLDQHVQENHGKSSNDTECHTCIEEDGVCNGCLDKCIAMGRDGKDIF